MAPFITQPITSSISTGRVPTIFKIGDGDGGGDFGNDYYYDDDDRSDDDYDHIYIVIIV